MKVKNQNHFSFLLQILPKKLSDLKNQILFVFASDFFLRQGYPSKLARRSIAVVLNLFKLAAH